jgi:hypothetical protein
VSDLEREHATLLAFVAGVSRIPLGTPAGVNAQQHHAKRLRIVRRAARHIIEHQFGDAEKAIAELLVEIRRRAWMREHMPELIDEENDW